MPLVGPTSLHFSFDQSFLGVKVRFQEGKEWLPGKILKLHIQRLLRYLLLVVNHQLTYAIFQINLIVALVGRDAVTEISIKELFAKRALLEGYKGIEVIRRRKFDKVIQTQNRLQRHRHV